MDTKICVICGEQVESNAIYCPKCNAGVFETKKIRGNIGYASTRPSTYYIDAALRLSAAEKYSTPLLHSPVYDSVDDLFFLPCNQKTFNKGKGFNASNCCGWLLSVDELSSWAEQEESRFPTCNALIETGDHLALIGTEYPRDSGGYIRRLVRTGQEAWFVYSYWNGTRYSSADIDPPFFVVELIQHPRKWIYREERVAYLVMANSQWLRTTEMCRHRAR